MAAQVQFPSGDQWKDIAFVTAWREQRRQKLEGKWKINFAPLLSGLSLSADPVLKYPPEAVELVQWESESLLSHIHRVESDASKKQCTRAKSDRARHQVPNFLAKDGPTWIVSPAAARALPAKIEKAKSMYDQGLDKKAQREIACGIMGGEVVCKNGHAFRVGYECGNRYCVVCGPRSAIKLFAKHRDRLLFVSTRLLLCGKEDCPECNHAVEEKRLPHWPPPRGIRPRVVVAHLDFTLKNTGERPGPEMMRELNQYIKKFCRLIEKRFHIRRSEYGLAYCDELGGNNTNAHAHGIYVGPWMPQRKGVCELSQLWAEVTGYNGAQPRSMSGGIARRGTVRRGADQFTDGSQGGFIISIKYARDFFQALHHAIKYPAKFAERSTPGRLADLEVIFHRVRRFHTLAAFYAPQVPEEEKPGGKRCPLCSELLSEPRRWETIAELTRRGLPDLGETQKRVSRLQALEGVQALPP